MSLNKNSWMRFRTREKTFMKNKAFIKKKCRERSKDYERLYLKMNKSNVWICVKKPDGMQNEFNDVNGRI